VTRHIEVLRSGPLATVQDLGRFGHRAVGVSPSGAADLGAMARANALIGNPAGAAVIEATFGGISLRAIDAVTVAVTGAACPGATMDAAVELSAGDTLNLDGARAGIRTYIAVAGGIDVAPVLGSRSTDTLSGLGPPPLAQGQLLPIGTSGGAATQPAASPPALPSAGVDLALTPGPRADWLAGEAWTALGESSWEVSPDSNRVAVRLRGDALAVRDASLPPEPLVRGAVQVPPDGRPIVFLADHPVTGGYPVVAVLSPASCDLIAQCRPGASVRLLSAHLDDDRAARAVR
jgi:biotin-dependent carboxylase-like uncharacterized protein